MKIRRLRTASAPKLPVALGCSSSFRCFVLRVALGCSSSFRCFVLRVASLPGCSNLVVKTPVSIFSTKIL
uniref:Uncharacterized protein n=1 Tax=Arundo donax TaxID=35708 RepID=A0A0A9EZM1_ARUDO